MSQQKKHCLGHKTLPFCVCCLRARPFDNTNKQTNLKRIHHGVELNLEELRDNLARGLKGQLHNILVLLPVCCISISITVCTDMDSNLKIDADTETDPRDFSIYYNKKR